MGTQVMLTPNPAREMKIDRVIIVGRDADKQFVQVLSIDALGKNPKLMQAYGSGYSWATAIWNYFGLAIVLGGIALSFFWHWWSFIPGFFLGTLVLKSTRQSTADFAMKILMENPLALRDFVQKGIVWDAPSESVVPE